MDPHPQSKLRAGSAVSFNGLDIQLPRAAMDEIVRHVRAVDPANQATKAILACYRRYQDATFAYASVDPTTEFDLFLYFEETSPSKLLGK